MASNLPLVTVAEFSEIIKQQFLDGDMRPVFGLGKGGIGKTESIEALAKSLGVGYVDIRLLLYSETDLKGIPFPNEDHTKSVWLQNDVLPVAERDGDSGILVLDEITSCSRSLRTAAYQLLNERRLGQYQLPENWLVVCLGNGEDDGGDFEGMEGNFMNRCSVYNVQVDYRSWLLWANRHNVNFLVTAYINWKPSDLHTYKETGDFSDLLFASPRSWEAVSNVLNKHIDDIEDRVTSSRILGNLGIEVGNRFLAFAKYREKTISPEEILNGNTEAIKKLNKNIRENTGNEIILMTINEVVKIISKEVDANANDPECFNGRVITFKKDVIEHVANAMRWFISLDRLEMKLMAITQFRDTCDNSRALMLSRDFMAACPEIRQLAVANSNVLASD